MKPQKPVDLPSGLRVDACCLCRNREGIPLRVAHEFRRAIEQLYIAAGIQIPGDMKAQTYRCPDCGGWVVITVRQLGLAS